MEDKALLTVEQLQQQNPNLLLATAIASMSSKLNLEQLKTFHGMVYVARAALRYNPEQWCFSVPLREFSNICGLREKSVDAFIKNVEALMNVKVRLNYVNKRELLVQGTTVLVGDIKATPLRHNFFLLEFSFPKTIWSLVKAPETYVTLNMNSINCIRASKYSIALYSLCKNYMSPTNPHLAPPQMTPDFFRDYLHLDGDGYANFGNVKKKVIEPAITELNLYTEINVTCDYKTEGKKVVGIKFRATYKDNAAEVNTDQVVQLDEVMKLIPAKFRAELKAVVAKHLDKHGAEYCISNIKYAVRSTNGTNPAVLIKFALEKDYAEPFRSQKQAVEIKKAETTAAEAKKRAKEDALEKEALRQQQRAVEIYNEMDAESRAVVDKELEAYLGPKPARLAFFLIEQGVSL